jgi:Tfp pilus assembly PilM family ATPase
VQAEGVRAVAAPTDGRSLLRADDLPSALSSVLSDSLKSLTTEIERCFAYVLQSYPDHNAQRVWLAGGGGRMPGLAAMLAGELGIPVDVLAGGRDPAGLDWELTLADVEIEPDAAASVGGALLDLECG